ncbi:MAG: response regulator [Porticoccaceae bacterium]
MAERILFVDDEPNILQAYQRTLRKSFNVVPATGGKQALEIAGKEGPFPVVVSDMNMPEMNGAQFLSVMKEKYPDTVRIMLTGNADQGTVVSAVNVGDVYRFLNKPCSPEEMTSAINAALSHHRLLRAEKELLEETVKGSIQAMVEILSIASPRIFGYAPTIKDYMVKCAGQMGIGNLWELEAAALLGQIGAVTLPKAWWTK